MTRQFSNYVDRLKHIGDNPFWVMNRSKAGRAPWWRTLWRGYAGYSLLLMLPLLGITQSMMGATGMQRTSDLHNLSVCLSIAGFLQLLYLGIKAALSTAPSVVQARQQGTLMALALTRINSADFADGVAVSEARTLCREFAVWIPAVAGVTIVAGQSVYSTLMLSLISVLVIFYFAYTGILISATSKDTQEAGRKASQQTLLTLGGTCLGCLCGGFMLGPLWLLHPVFAYLCSMWGTGSPMGCDLNNDFSLLFWCGWPVFVLPIYAWMVLNVRQSAIRALERVRII